MNEESTEVIRIMDRAPGRDFLLHGNAFLAKSTGRILVATGIKTIAADGGYLSEDRTEAGNLSRTLNITYRKCFRNPLRVVAMSEPQAREKHLALSNRVSRDRHAIRSDLVKCRRTLQYFVGNAVKFRGKARRKFPPWWRQAACKLP